MSIKNLVDMYGAEYNKFNQTSILKTLNVMVARQVEFPRGYVDVQSDNDTTRGVCHGLCMMMLNGYFDFTRFVELIKTTKGMGQVRGYQFIQTTAGRLTVIRSSCPNFEVESKWKSSKCFLTFASYIQKQKDCFFYLVFDCIPDGSHAICMQKLGEKIAVFDPNYGKFTFSGQPAKNVMAFVDDLTTFESCYGGIGQKWRNIVKLTAK